MSYSSRKEEVWEVRRRHSTLEVPSDSSKRRGSRDSSRHESNSGLSSSYREDRHVDVRPGLLDVPGRDGGRRHSNLEIAVRSRNSSRASRRVETTARYRYSDLDPKVRGSIRLIRVWPELVDGKIACEIEHVTTDSSYTALSYTWGSSKDPSETIIIDSRRFTVRRNLYAFLDHAREFHAGLPLWIDAICINQEDVEEKNRQVQMMSRIYSDAKDVYVWLGPRVEFVGHCIRRMQAYEDMSDTKMALSSAEDTDFWKGFKAINSASYWDRVWVIQEFIQPKTGRIIQGDRWISFESFQNTIRRFDRQIYRLVLQYWVFGPRRNESFNNYISNIHPLWQRRMERAKTDAIDEPDAKWALLSGSRFCMDVRDRVYGILPLATHGLSLRVDYDLNPFELLLESIWLEHDTE
jgi:Heterokaryon incompatibility protein (HET)